MVRLCSLLKPFSLYILQMSLKSVGAILLITLGAKITLNLEKDSLFALSVGAIVLINLLLLPITTKTLFTSNLSWLLNLPVSKSKLILLNIIQTIISFIIGGIISLLSFPISLFLIYGSISPSTDGVSNDIKYKMVSLVSMGLNDISGVTLSTMSIAAFFLLSFLIFISPSYSNALVVQNVNSINDQKKRTKKSLQIVGILYALLFLTFVLRDFFDDRIFARMNIFLVLSFCLPGAWVTTCKTLIDESRRSKHIGYLLAAFVLFTNITTTIIVYNDVTNPKLNIRDRIASFSHLGYLAPSVHDELLKEVQRDRSIKIDISPLLLAKTKDPNFLYTLFLKAPLSNKNKEILNSLYKNTGKISPISNPPEIFMSDKEAYQFVKKLAYFDMSLASGQGILSLLDAFHKKYQRIDYDLCWYISSKELTKNDIELFLNADNPVARNCGLIFSRYYPEFDLKNSLYQASQASSPEESLPIAITIAAYTGKQFSDENYKSLTLKDWTQIDVNCPKTGKDFINEFDKFSYTQKLRCPRRYVQRKPFMSGGLDNYIYTKDPSLKHCDCLKNVVKR